MQSFAAFIFIVLVYASVAWGFQLLYNYMVPGVFELGPVLTYWQAAAVLLLLSFLGFGK